MDQRPATANNDSDQDIALALERLPAPIRDFVRGGKCALFADAYRERYDLHIDQAGALERELTSLLMGLETPPEFAIALIQEIKVAPETAQQLIDDVNTEIFVPLQEQMRAMPKSSTPAQKKAPVVPMTPAIAQQPRVVPAAPANLPGTPLADALAKAGVSATIPVNLLADHEESHINLAPKAPPPAAAPREAGVDPYRESFEEK